MFDEPDRFARVYCSGCPVVAQCRARGDETQSTGVWGGEYRDIFKGYRVHHRNGSVSRRQYTQGLYVKGDNAKGYEPEPIPDGAISTQDATVTLGLVDRRHLARIMRDHSVKPVVCGAGARPDYWDPEDVERVRARRATGRDPRVPDDALTTQEATEALGFKAPKSLYKRANEHGVKPILRGIGKRPSFWAREDIERIKSGHVPGA